MKTNLYALELAGIRKAAKQAAIDARKAAKKPAKKINWSKDEKKILKQFVGI